MSEIDNEILQDVLAGKSPLETYINRYFSLSHDLRGSTAALQDLECKIHEALGDTIRRIKDAERFLQAYENIFNHTSLLTSIKIAIDAQHLNAQFAMEALKMFVKNFEDKINELKQAGDNVCVIKPGDAK